jgi:hypothetical protein
LTEELILCLSELYLSSHWKEKWYMPYTMNIWGTHVVTTTVLSLPATTPPYVWAAG